MQSVEQDILIKASPEVVFNYLTDPANLTRMLAPNMLAEVDSIESLAAGGYRYKWRYKMLGFSTEAESETVEYVPHERYAVKSTGFVETVSRWMLEAEGRDTRATFGIDYELPPTLLGRLSQKFAANQIQYSVSVAVMSLKRLVEAQAPSRAESPAGGGRPDHVQLPEETDEPLS